MQFQMQNEIKSDKFWYTTLKELTIYNKKKSKNNRDILQYANIKANTMIVVPRH